MITNKTIVNLLEIFDTDFAKRKLSEDEMQHIVYSVQTCQSLSTEAMHYGNVVIKEIDEDVMDVTNRVRFYLRRVTDYAMHDLEPMRYMHIEAEVPALAEILRHEHEHPWHVVGVELIKEIDEADYGRSEGGE